GGRRDHGDGHPEDARAPREGPGLRPASGVVACGGMHPLAELHAAVEEAAGALEHGPVRSRPTLERPKQAGFGDYSTNVAMLLAPAAGAPPRDVAERVGEQLRARLGDSLADVQVA